MSLYHSKDRRELVDETLKRVIDTPVTGALATYDAADLFSADSDRPEYWDPANSSLMLIAEQAADIAALKDQADMAGKQFGLQATFRKKSVAGAVAQVETITTVADVADSLDGKFFSLNDEDGTVGVWIDTDDSGTAAPAGATALDRQIEVTGVVTADDDEAVATAVASAINGDSKFSAVAVGAVITVTHATAGATPGGADGDTEFTFAITTGGSSEVIHQSVVSEVATIDPENESSQYSPQIRMPNHDWDEVAIYLFVPIPTAAALTELTLVAVA